MRQPYCLLYTHSWMDTCTPFCALYIGQLQLTRLFQVQGSGHFFLARNGNHSDANKDLKLIFTEPLLYDILTSEIIFGKHLRLIDWLLSSIFFNDVLQEAFPAWSVSVCACLQQDIKIAEAGASV